jgi:hypothetical protein
MTLKEAFESMTLKELRTKLREYKRQQAKGISDYMIINYLEILIDQKSSN